MRQGAHGAVCLAAARAGHEVPAIHDGASKQYVTTIDTAEIAMASKGTTYWRRTS